MTWARQGRRLLTRRKAAAPQLAGDTSGLWAAVPPVPLGNGLAFPEFAAALKARLQAEAAERAAVTGRRRALPPHDEDEQAHDGGLGDEDDGTPLAVLFAVSPPRLPAWMVCTSPWRSSNRVLFWLMLNKEAKWRRCNVP